MKCDFNPLNHNLLNPLNFNQWRTQSYGTATLTNSIIANSVNGGDIVNAGILNTYGTNLVEDGSISEALNVDPNLSPLQDNGGTTLTHVPLEGSPAINAGDNAQIPSDTLDLDGDGNTDELIPFDQRGEGFDRVVNGTVDLGAVEVQDGDGGNGGENQPPVVEDATFTLDPSFTFAREVIASDPDGDVLDFTITDGNDDLDGDGTPPFFIESSEDSYLILVDDSDDIELANEFILTVEVSDGELTDTATIEIFIDFGETGPTANNESFSFVGVPDQSPLVFDVLENDIANDGSVLTITDFPTTTDQGGTVELDEESGRLLYTPNPEFTQGVDTFTYTIANESGGTDQGTVEVTFTSDVGENEPPTIDFVDIFDLDPEFVFDGDFVGAIAACDPDEDFLEFTIIEGNDDLDGDGEIPFAIESFEDDGAIFVNDSDDLQLADDFILSVEVSDGELTDIEEIAIALSSSNTAPIVEDATFNIEAPVVNGDLLGFVSAFDFEDDELTFAIVGGNPDLDEDRETAFTIDSFTGDILVNDSDELDFDSNPSFNLIVEVSDGELINTSEITINFTDDEPDPSIEEQEPNDTISNAIATGITPQNQEPFLASGVIGNNPNVSPEFDFDIYAFDLVARDRVTVDIDAENLGSELDSFIEILDSSGNLLASNDDEIGGKTLDSFLSYTPTVDGTFYAAVSGFSSTGNYEIYINVDSVGGGADEPNDTFNTAIFTELSSANPGRFDFSGSIGDNANLISPDLDVDLFELQLDAGDSLTATIDTSELATSFDSVLRLFDQSGNEVAFNDDENSKTLDSFIEFTAEVSGRYFVGISGFGNETYFPSQAGSGVVGSTGDYNLELVVNNNQQEGTNEPNDIINNAVDTREFLTGTGDFLVQGVIGDNNNLSNLGKDVDLYRINLTQGERIAIDLDTPASSSLDLFLRVFNANGKEIDTNDDGNAPGEQISLDPFLNFTAPSSGTYYVGISDLVNDFYSPYVAESGLEAGATGTYTLEMKKTGISFTFDQTLREGESNQILGSRPRNDTRETALEISLDETKTDEIGDNIDYTTVPGLDVDLYTLTLEANQKVAIEVNSSDVGFDSVLRLFNSVGEEIAFNDDFGVGTDSQIEITIPETGEYFIGVSGYGNEDYDPDTAGSGAPFASTGSYELTVTEEETEDIIAGAEEENDTLATATATDLTPNNRGNFKQTNAIGNNVSLEEVGLDVDLLRVGLDSNTRLTVNINTANFDSNFDSLLRIFDSNGSQLAFNDDENSNTNDSFLEFVPEQAGTYYVGVSGLGNETYNPNTAGSGNSGVIGDYEIEINVSEAIAQETPSNDTLGTAIKPELTNNRFTRSGFIGDNSNVEGDVDFYQVALQAQDILTMEIEAETLGSNLESFLRLFKADGEEIDLNYEPGDFPDPELTVTIQEDNTYYVGVSAFGNDNYDPTVAGSGSAGTTGEYELTIQLQRPIAAQAPGQEIRPTVNKDTGFTNSNNAITIDVLNNDTANDDQGFLEITNFSATTEKGGTIELDNNSRLIYTPDSEFAGVDTFTYTASNESGGSAQGTVEVTVNRPPQDAFVQVNLDIRAIPGQEAQLENGLQIGDEFLVDVRFQDLFTENAEGVTFGYADLIFDPNVVKVVTDNNSIDGEDGVVDGIVRNSDYTLTSKGTVRNAQGLVEEVGAGTFASPNDPPENELVFSLHMEAVGGGNTAILGSRATQGNFSAITILGALGDQRSRTNFGEINVAEGINSEEVVNAFAASLNNDINLQQQGVASVGTAISAMEVNVEFQDDNGASLQEVAVGDTFNIVLSAKDLRPEGQQRGVFSAFADIEYDTVLVDINNAALNDPFTSPVLSLADVIDEGKGVVNALGGSNANFTPITEETQEFAVLTATASAPGTFNISTNAPEAETAINTLFGVDVGLNDGTIYEGNTLTITGEASSDNADLVVTEFDAVIDHVLGGETEINLTVKNQGDGKASGFQLEVLYYRADNLEELATETPTVVKTLAFNALSAGETVTLENQALSLPLEALLEEALEDDPSVFGQEGDSFESNNIDFLGVRIVDNVSTNENETAFENNGVDGTKGVNVDDITFFPWDFLNSTADGVKIGEEDDLISDGFVNQVDADAVFSSIGQVISQDVTESNLGVDLNRMDFDLDGAISPVDAVRVVNRIGYEINPAVIEE